MKFYNFVCCLLTLLLNNAIIKYNSIIKTAVLRFRQGTEFTKDFQSMINQIYLLSFLFSI